MDSHTKLLLLPCSGEETAELAQDIYQILRKDYGLEEQVEILVSNTKNRIEKNTPKDRRHPLVGDFFPDGEAQVDIGKNYLEDVIRGKHVVLVEHLLTPNRKIHPESDQVVSVNDHHMAVRGFLDVIENTETLQRTLAVPYLSYVRAHSILKYKKQRFEQFDSIKLTLRDFQKGFLNTLITIDPHSEKVAQICEDLGIDFHGINPFQSGRSINPFKLGLYGEQAKEVLRRLRPFQERLKDLIEGEGKHYIVCVDDGTERRTENFTERAYHILPPEEAYALIAYLGKRRVSYDESIITFKPFSQINEKNIDSEGTYHIIDDMFSSGRTVNNAAKVFKDHGAKRVEAMTSHAVTTPTQYDSANDRTYIDKVTALDTVPQNPKLDIECIKASADLLSAEIYKAHQKLVASR
ncbi:MAG: hypothetical protein ABIA37_03225 [Candidatus Woesearchaeota archaeon]